MFRYELFAVTHPLSLTEIQARLPEQVQLVQYAVLPEKVAIWVVSKTRFNLIEKPITAVDLAKKIDDYQAAVMSKASSAALKQAGRELYELLIPTEKQNWGQALRFCDSSIVGNITIQILIGVQMGTSGKVLSETAGINSSSLSRRHDAARLKVRDNVKLSKLASEIVKQYRTGD